LVYAFIKDSDHQASDKVWGWQLQPDGTYAQLDLE
jgi:hypothetical protein